MKSFSLRQSMGAVLLTVLMALLPILQASSSFGADTIVFLVRHAEKDGPGDAAKLLVPEGVKRAKDLSHILKDARLTAIIVSPLPRTMETAKPIQEVTGLSPKPLLKGEIASEILTNQRGGRILVVGHSNTLEDIAFDLGLRSDDGAKVDLGIGDDTFDNLFVIQILDDGTVSLVHLRYGEPSP